MKMAFGKFMVILFVSLAVCSAASAQNYFNENTWRERQPGELSDRERSDHSDEGKVRPQNTGDGEDARRQRVDAAVNQQMENWMNGSGDSHDSHGTKMSKSEFESMLKLAGAGNTSAIASVADAYKMGNGTTQSDAQALEWYKKGVEYGMVEYHSVIGDMYRDYGNSGVMGKIKSLGSDATAKDNQTAREWYERGYAAGDPASAMQLGIMYRDGAGGLAQDQEKAALLYNVGMQLHKERNEKLIEEKRKEFYEAAMRTEGVGSTAPAGQVAGQDPAGVPKDTRIGGQDCTVSASSEKASGFAAVFLANCPRLTRGAEAKDAGEIKMAGFVCKAEAATQQGYSHRLLCNPPAKEGDIMIGEASCRLTRAAKGDAYGAVCDRAVDKSIQNVKYNGMECAIKVGREAQNATLNCKGDFVAAGPVSVSIGKHSCLLTPAGSPSVGEFSTTYEASCGGLDEEKKTAKDIPKTLKVKGSDCEISPWPVNAMKKDFEVNCK